VTSVLRRCEGSRLDVRGPTPTNISSAESNFRFRCYRTPGSRGEPPNADSVRRVWNRVCRDKEEREARLAGDRRDQRRDLAWRPRTRTTAPAVSLPVGRHRATQSRLKRASSWPE
jgi:hypothetical protein